MKVSEPGGTYAMLSSIITRFLMEYVLEGRDLSCLTICECKPRLQVYRTDKETLLVPIKSNQSRAYHFDPTTLSSFA